MGRKKVKFLRLNVIQITRTTFKSMPLLNGLNKVSTILTLSDAVLWMNGHGLNWFKFTTCCYYMYYSKPREVTRSAVILSVFYLQPSFQKLCMAMGPFSCNLY